MSMHTEWDNATSCDVELIDAATAEEELDVEVIAPYVLVLGGAGGGALGVEGSREELQRFARRIAEAVADPVLRLPGRRAIEAV